MSLAEDLARIDQAHLSQEQSVELATALVSLHANAHPAEWFAVAGDQPFVDLDTVKKFLELLTDPESGCDQLDGTRP